MLSDLINLIVDPLLFRNNPYYKTKLYSYSKIKLSNVTQGTL